MKERLAVIGSGIAGLGAAYHLSTEYDVTLFEKNQTLGGHTNTITITEDNKNVNIDTGFIVFNKKTYPNLVRLFDQLNVEYQPGSMSFSVYNKNTNLQYAGNNIKTLFAQKKNIFRKKYWKFLLEINRFNSQAPAQLNTDKVNVPLSEYLSKEGYSDDFIMNFIIPMGSAVWSTPIHKMLRFPAKTLIRFFHNHGFLGLNTQFQWLTVKNGSKNYILKILEKSRFDHKINCPVHEVEFLKKQVGVKTKHESFLFDKVILAAHADESLKLLKNPNELQKILLSNFKYEKNQAILHTDPSIMPPLKKIWSSWNYKIKEIDGVLRSSTVYYMNSLQNLKTKTQYFLSMNDFDEIDPKKILRVIDYEHPLFNLNAIDAQDKLSQLNENSQIYFCGSYFKYGFHEDALTSALDLSARLLKKECEEAHV